MERAGKYIEKALNIAIENGIRNFMASTVFIKAYIALLTGNRKRFRREVETSYSLLNDPLVGMSNKLTLRVMHICNLSMHGDFPNFFHQQQLIQESIDKRVVKQTVAAPYFYIWGASCLTSMGNTAKALDLLKTGVNVSSTAKTEHMLSQLLQWQAYILAMHGNSRSAAVKIEESSQLREIAGGPFYKAFHLIMAGAVLGRLKKKQAAKEAFTEAISLADSISSPYLKACALMQKSYFEHSCYSEKQSLPSLEQGLELMTQHGYDHFWGWEPSAMRQLLTTAVVNNIHKAYSRRLAWKRLKVFIADDGDSVPLLHFTLLDGFSLSTNNKVHITVEQLTPLQRELLSLLLISKEKKIGQEKVQLLLWPDSSPEKSRKKLDTLLGRLRSTFAEYLPAHPQNYLVLNKGIVSLENSESDVEHFFYNCETGFNHVRRDEFWQAGNRFNEALQVWKGTLPTDTFRNDSIYAYEDVLVATFEKMSLTWAQILADAERQMEAIPLLTRLLRTNPLAEKAIVLLCRLYSCTYQTLKIRETLDAYRKALQSVDYDKEEIDEMIEGVVKTMEEESSVTAEG
jgi:DNA-binding SARP family transcriptional activator